MELGSKGALSHRGKDTHFLLMKLGRKHERGVSCLEGGREEGVGKFSFAALYFVGK